MRILVVDDSKTWRNQARSWLADVGHEVTLAADGLEALCALKTSDSIDLVLFDVNMPKLDGIGFLRLARAVPAMRETAMIALTSTATTTVISELKANGATMTLAKPTGRYELLGQLEIAMDPGPSATAPRPVSACGVPRPVFGITAVYHAALVRAINEAWVLVCGEEATATANPMTDDEREKSPYYQLEIAMGSDRLRMFIDVDMARELAMDSQDLDTPPDAGSSDLEDFLAELANNAGGLLIRILEQKGVIRQLGLPSAKLVDQREHNSIECRFITGSGHFSAGVTRYELAA